VFYLDHEFLVPARWETGVKALSASENEHLFVEKR
jgi:hypothetical protein